MTCISSPNSLIPTGFKLTLKRAPEVQFFVQKIGLPGFSLPPVETGNPFLAIPFGGDHLNYEPLQVTFIVDENLANYKTIHNWMRALGKPSYEEYEELNANPDWTQEGKVSDIILSILDSQNRTTAEFVFRDAFPIQLNGFPFDSTITDPVPVTCSSMFKYQIFDIN